MRLRMTMPRGVDERIVILDIDEKSLAEVGRWPWARNRDADSAVRSIPTTKPVASAATTKTSS